MFVILSKAHARALLILQALTVACSIARIPCALVEARVTLKMANADAKPVSMETSVSTVDAPTIARAMVNAIVTLVHVIVTGVGHRMFILYFCNSIDRIVPSPAPRLRIRSKFCY